MLLLDGDEMTVDLFAKRGQFETGQMNGYVLIFRSFSRPPPPPPLSRRVQLCQIALATGYSLRPDIVPCDMVVASEAAKTDQL
jgi:hypothetical protein